MEETVNIRPTMTKREVVEAFAKIGKKVSREEARDMLKELRNKK